MVCRSGCGFSPDKNEIPVSLDVLDFIGRREFIRAFCLVRAARYREFLRHVEWQLTLVMDAESELLSLNIEKIGQNLQCNTMVTLGGVLARRDEQLKLTGHILWIAQRKFFRGTFWRDREPKSDAQYYSEARSLFYAGRYSEFLEIARYISDSYQDSRAFRKMQQIAEQRQEA